MFTVGSKIYDTVTGSYWSLVHEVPSDPTSAFTVEKLVYNPANNILVNYYVETTNLAVKKQYKMFNTVTNTPTPRTYDKSLISYAFESTEKVKQGIMDWNGNSIWEAPVNIGSISFKTRLLLGISHIMIEFLPSSNYNNAELLTGRGFCYDCRHPGIFIDSYGDYVLKNRDYDIAMRQIQSDKQLWQSAVSTAENVGFGAAFGKASGAKAAGIGSVIETIGTYFINSYFDPKIQEQYDLRYARMTDQISLIGDSITNVLNVIADNSGLFKKYTLSVTTDASNRYDNDISANGYYCDETTSNLQSLFLNGRILQADNVVVEGACTLAGKQQVVRRLMNGVEFI